MANLLQRVINWIGRILERPKPKRKRKAVRVKLLEPFKDFKVIVRGSSHHGRYKRKREIKPKKYPFKLSLKKLEKAIKNLQRAYPKHDYRIEEREVKGIKFHVVLRGKTGLSNPPIYLQLDEGKLFVPSSYYKRKKRLTCSVIHYRLSSLGLL